MKQFEKLSEENEDEGIEEVVTTPESMSETNNSNTNIITKTKRKQAFFSVTTHNQDLHSSFESLCKNITPFESSYKNTASLRTVPKKSTSKESGWRFQVPSSV